MCFHIIWGIRADPNWSFLPPDESVLIACGPPSFLDHDRSARTRTRRSRPRCSWCRRTPNAVRSTFQLSETSQSFQTFLTPCGNDLVMGCLSHAADGCLFRVVPTVSQLFEALSRAAMLNPDPPEPGKAVAGQLLYRAWQEIRRFVPDLGFLMRRIVFSLVQVRRRGTMT